MPDPHSMKSRMSEEEALELVVREFRRVGILLESDRRLPSLTALVVGRPLRGSWWGHPSGRRIWRVLNKFCRRRDVLTTKLVSGKVTFVHRRLWPQLLAVSTSREEWQTASLSSEASALLRAVDRKGEIRTDGRLPKREIPGAARELEKMLLVQSEEVHTERGTHAKILRSWGNWSREVRFTRKPAGVEKSKGEFERLLQSLNDTYSADGQLPWSD
jgi:hypothetical protein